MSDLTQSILLQHRLIEESRRSDPYASPAWQSSTAALLEAPLSPASRTARLRRTSTRYLESIEAANAEGRRRVQEMEHLREQADGLYERLHNPTIVPTAKRIFSAPPLAPPTLLPYAAQHPAGSSSSVASDYERVLEEERRERHRVGGRAAAGGQSAFTMYCDPNAASKDAAEGHSVFTMSNDPNALKDAEAVHTAFTRLNDPNANLAAAISCVPTVTAAR